MRHLLETLLLSAAIGCSSPTASAQEPTPASASTQTDASAAAWADFLALSNSAKSSRPSTPTQPDATSDAGTEETKLPGGHTVTLRKSIHRKGKLLESAVLQPRDTATLCPGMMLWRHPLEQGLITRVPHLQGSYPVDVTVIGLALPAGSSSSFVWSTGKIKDYQDGLREVLTKSQNASASVTISISEAETLDMALLDLGMSVKYWGAKVSGSLHSGRTSKRSFLVVAIDQTWFTATGEINSDGNMFPRNVFEDIDNQNYVFPPMQQGDEPVFVKSVTYGRRMLVTVSSESSQESLKRALAFKYDGAGIGIQGGVTTDVLSTWATMDVKGTVVGGAGDGFVAAVFGDRGKLIQNLGKYLEETGAMKGNAAEKLQLAQPISFYSVYATDRVPMQVAETASYTGTVPIAYTRDAGDTQADLTLSTEPGHAKRIGGKDDEIDTDDHTLVQVSYALRIGKGNRTVEARIVWTAWEANKNSKPNDTVIQSVREWYEVYRQPNEDPRPIESLRGNLRASFKADMAGEDLHGLRDFPNVGQMQSIKVEFDMDGSNDLQCQKMRGTIALSMRLGAAQVPLDQIPQGK
jgi:hypothetical protein